MTEDAVANLDAIVDQSGSIFCLRRRSISSCAKCSSIVLDKLSLVHPFVGSRDKVRKDLQSEALATAASACMSFYFPGADVSQAAFDPFQLSITVADHDCSE